MCSLMIVMVSAVLAASGSPRAVVRVCVFVCLCDCVCVVFPRRINGWLRGHLALQRTKGHKWTRFCRLTMAYSVYQASFCYLDLDTPCCPARAMIMYTTSYACLPSLLL